MKIYYKDNYGTLYQGDVLEVLASMPNGSVDTIITSPPYYKARNYLPNNHPDKKKEIGDESTPELYIEHLLKITKELKRVLKNFGTMFWVHADVYKPSRNVPAKSLLLTNEILVQKMVYEQKWILRNRIIWEKLGHMPGPWKDRLTNAYEPIYFFVKNQEYWTDLDKIREPHKQASIERIKRAVSNQNKYMKQKDKSLIQNLVKPRPNLKDVHIGTITDYRFENGDYLAVPLNPKGKNPGNIWKIPLENLSELHFAHFPQALVRKCIDFGCPSEICKKCGKARIRIVKKEYKPTRPGLNTGYGKSGTDLDSNKSFHKRDISKYRMKIKYNTIGWTNCNCGVDFVPATILDPFMGAGTTALVSAKMNRKWIGIEIYENYCEITVKRLKKEIGILLKEE